MKEKLSEHVHQVCRAVFPADSGVRISVYDGSGKTSTFPLKIPLTHEFMVFLDLTPSPELLETAQTKLASFTGKRMSARQDDTSAWLYWGEGDRLTPQSDSTIETGEEILVSTDIHSPRPDNEITWLKTATVLPAWLDGELFDKLDARHEPKW